MAAPNQITPPQLRCLIGSLDTPTILNTRYGPVTDLPSGAFRDGLQHLKAGFSRYDTLYRPARDGQSDTRNWSTGHQP